MHKDLAVSNFENKRSPARLGATAKVGSRNAQPGQRSGILGGKCHACPRPPSTVHRPPSRPSLPPRARHPIRDCGKDPEIGGSPLHPPILLLIGKFDIGLAGACSAGSATGPPTLPSVDAPGYIEAPSCLYRTTKPLGHPSCFQLDRLSSWYTPNR